MTTEFIPRIRQNKIVKIALRCFSALVYLLTFFSKQNRFDRAQKKIALTKGGLANARRARDAYWAQKKESGRLRVQMAGEIKAPPFPARGSLLSEDERNDPLSK